MSDRAHHSLGPYVFCPLCGQKLTVTNREDLPRRYCPPCDRIFYHNPIPAAGGVIMNRGRVLLVRRKYAPQAGKWTFPAGFLEYFEAPPMCAVREIREETGLETEAGEIFGVYSGADDPRHTAILVLYRMRMVGGDLKPGDDASEVRYFSPEEVPEEIAFEAHRTALRELFGERLTARWAQPESLAVRRRGQAGKEEP
jgi:ADP-ribose pyrophosphatase YjhB (NUDIX family)